MTAPAPAPPRPPDARARLAAALVYLRDVVAAAPDGALESAELTVRASVADAAAAVAFRAGLPLCAHPECHAAAIDAALADAARALDGLAAAAGLLADASRRALGVCASAPAPAPGPLALARCHAERLAELADALAAELTTGRATWQRAKSAALAAFPAPPAPACPSGGAE